MSDYETYSDDDAIECPHPSCRMPNASLQELEIPDQHDVEITCDHCDRPFKLGLALSVSYKYTASVERDCTECERKFVPSEAADLVCVLCENGVEDLIQ